MNFYPFLSVRNWTGLDLKRNAGVELIPCLFTYGQKIHFLNIKKHVNYNPDNLKSKNEIHEMKQT